MKSRRVTGGVRGLLFEGLADAGGPGYVPAQVYKRAAHGEDQRGVAAATLMAASYFRRELDDLIDESVALARINGATWKYIGECLGITQQAASARFGQKVGR